MKRLFYTLLIIESLSLSMMVTSCKESTVYYKYAHTPIAGWEKNDTLIFHMPAFAEGGEFTEELGLRISDNYPFTSVCIIVDNTIIPKDNALGAKTESDTITCSLFDSDGSI